MSASYKHFTTKERERILEFIAQGLKPIEMAQKLGRSRSSISRELKRNSNEDGSYSPSEADKKYHQRRKHSTRKKCLDNIKLREDETFSVANQDL